MSRDYFNIGVYLAAIVAIIDQFTKNWFMRITTDTEPVIRLSSFLNLRLGMNKGVTFGLLNSYGEWMPFILIGVAIAILLLLLRWLKGVKTAYAGFGLGFVMGGAVGNVIDRLRFGAVIDFIDFHYAGYHWYTFNVADSAIVLGVGLLLLESFVLSRKHR